MRPSSLTPKARFASLIEEFRGHPKITLPILESQSTKRFGSSGLRVDDKIFAMLSKNRLVVKLPRQRVAQLVSSGDGDEYDPGHGRLMKEWLSVKPTSKIDWLALTREAMKFVAGDS